MLNYQTLHPIKSHEIFVRINLTQYGNRSKLNTLFFLDGQNFENRLEMLWFPNVSQLPNFDP